MAKAIPITNVRTDLFQVIDYLERGGDVVTLTRRGEPVAVMLSHSDYERLMETLEVLGDPDYFSEMVAVAESSLSR